MRQRLLARLMPLALIAAAASWTSAAAADWPQFRGPNRDGMSTDTGLLANWPDGGPAEIWRIDIGEGYSGPSITGDRLYIMFAGEEEGEPREFAAAFDATTGAEIWRTPIAGRIETVWGNGPRSTPAVDGDMLFVLGSLGDMAGLKSDTGEKLWQVSLTETFGSSVPDWGFSTSALVDGDQVVVESGGPEGKSYAALDRLTGETLWTSGEARGPGYSSALVVDLPEGRRYVYVAGGKLRCIDPEGGEVWAHDWPRGESHSMPVFVAPNRVFASGAEGVGAQLVEISPGEEGAGPVVSQVWAQAAIRNHFATSIYHDGFLYGFDNATLKAISIEDGSLAWAKRGLGKGSLIFAEGRLIILSDKGKLVLAEASPEAFQEVGSVQALTGRSWTPPSLANGRLYVRNHTEMVSYDITR